MSAERWELASVDDLPDRFTDPRCDDFRTICSNGFEGDISIGSAFVHKPRNWPQCFPNGEDGDCSCTAVIVRRLSA
jgi:hypothetical protein